MRAIAVAIIFTGLISELRRVEGDIREKTAVLVLVFVSLTTAAFLVILGL